MKRSLIFSIIFSILILTACLSPRSGSVSTPAMASTPSETSSPPPTATPTATPTETPIPRVEAVICTSENFLDKDHEVDPESLFDGTYLEALREISTPFDVTKIKNVALGNFIGGGLLEGRNAIRYIPVVPTKPNFPIKGTEPFHRYLTGHLIYQGVTYAVMPIEFYYAGRPEQNVWVITLYRFLEPDNTDAAKISSMKVWENDMNTTIILSTNAVPRLSSGEPIRRDPLVARTFVIPDINERIDEFVNHNSLKAGGDLTALDGLVFLTNITKSSIHIYE